MCVRERVCVCVCACDCVWGGEGMRVARLGWGVEL